MGRLIVVPGGRHPASWDEFGDLTAAPLVDVRASGDDVYLTFADSITEPEVERVYSRVAGLPTNGALLRESAAGALANNRAFINLASPSNAQAVAQIKDLSRQMNGVIRLLLNRLDGTD